MQTLLPWRYSFRCVLSVFFMNLLFYPSFLSPAVDFSSLSISDTLSVGSALLLEFDLLNAE